MEQAGMTPDPWQSRLLRSASDRISILTCRQAGKSQTVAALALQTAMCQPRSLILLLSPSERQSGELALKVANLYEVAGRPVRPTKQSALQLHLENGSRIIALPENEKNIRGFSGASLLVVDEASRVSDDLYRAVRPMLGTSKGRLVTLTTPFGQRGWFYEEWINLKRRWDRITADATQVPRLSPEFLEEERQSMGDAYFRQEYFCSFSDAVGLVFNGNDISAATSSEVTVKW